MIKQIPVQKLSSNESITESQSTNQQSIELQSNKVDNNIGNDNNSLMGLAKQVNQFKDKKFNLQQKLFVNKLQRNSLKPNNRFTQQIRSIKTKFPEDFFKQSERIIKKYSSSLSSKEKPSFLFNEEENMCQTSIQKQNLDPQEQKSKKFYFAQQPKKSLPQFNSERKHLLSPIENFQTNRKTQKYYFKKYLNQQLSHLNKGHKLSSTTLQNPFKNHIFKDESEPMEVTPKFGYNNKATKTKFQMNEFSPTDEDNTNFTAYLQNEVQNFKKVKESCKSSENYLSLYFTNHTNNFSKQINNSKAPPQTTSNQLATSKRTDSFNFENSNLRQFQKCFKIRNTSKSIDQRKNMSQLSYQIMNTQQDLTRPESRQEEVISQFKNRVKQLKSQQKSNNCLIHYIKSFNNQSNSNQKKYLCNMFLQQSIIQQNC